MIEWLNSIGSPPWWLLVSALCICVGALVMTWVNLKFFQPAPPIVEDAGPLPSVAVCIPARNEEQNIQACVRAILANDYPDVRVYVYDDQSTDATPRILQQLMAEDARVRLVPTRTLAAGWVGKQWACAQLGQDAEADVVLFIDADVRLQPNALGAAVAAKRSLNAELLSTFPRQETLTLGEAMLVPMIFFILLSYLPFGRMRRSKDPNASAACGQFIMVSKDTYMRLNPHDACRNSMHEGVKIPRVFRKAGLHTDLFDGTDVVSCRMYDGFLSTWRGFAKNAYEGLGSPVLLIFLTVVHIVGHVLPWLVLALSAATGRVPSIEFGLSLACVLVAGVQRVMLALRFRQSPLFAIAHPLSVALMTVIQWHSFVLSLTGRRGWRGRSLSTSAVAGSASI